MELSKNSFRIVAVAGAFLLSSQIQAKAPSAVVSEQNNTQQSSQTTANTTSLDLNNAKKEKEVEGFVKNAADYIEKNGKDKAFAEFNKKQGLFTKGDSYILIIGYDQKVLVNPINPERINKIATFLDPDGDVLSEEMINLAKKGGGWMEYSWVEPTTKVMTCKKSYVIPMNNSYFIASGYYYSPGPKGCGS